MIDHDFSAQGKLSQHLKDVRLILEKARHFGLPLPGSQLHENLLVFAEELGLGERDNSAIISAIENFGNKSLNDEIESS